MFEMVEMWSRLAETYQESAWLEDWQQESKKETYRTGRLEHQIKDGFGSENEKCTCTQVYKQLKWSRKPVSRFHNLINNNNKSLGSANETSDT